MKRTLHIHDYTGDTVYDLDIQVDEAKEAFVQAMLNGNLAFESKDGKNPQVFEFNPDAKRINIIAPQSGG